MTPTQSCIHTFRAAELRGTAYYYPYARSGVNQALRLSVLACYVNIYQLQEPMRIEQDFFR